jgi:uncharacterized protein YbbC (DUF1343 family)
VRTGVEALMASGYAAVRGEKVGVVTNPTGILPDLRHEVDVMHGDDAVNLVAVFGPEHGFRGTAQAGGSEGFYYDPRTGLRSTTRTARAARHSPTSLRSPASTP